MNKTVLHSWPLFFGVLTLMIGNGLQGTLLGLRAGHEGFSPLTIGLIMSCYQLGYLAGSFATPKLVDNVGHIRVFAALASLASACALIYPLFISPPAWAAARFVVGFSFVGLFVVVESWMNGISTLKNRNIVISMYMVTSYLGLLLGQFLLNAADPAKSDLFILISILVSLALVPISLLRQPTPDFQAPEMVKLKKLLRISPLGTGGVFFVGIQGGIIFSMGAVYTSLSGMSTSETSVFMAAIILGGVLAQYPAGFLSERFGHRAVITGCSVAALAVSLLAGILPFHVWLDTAMGFLIGVCAFPIYGMLLAYTNDRLKHSEMTAASSRLIFVNGAGAIIGPVMVSIPMQAYGAPFFFFALALVYAGMSGLALARSLLTEAPPIDEQADMVYVPTRMSPVMGEIIDPDEEEDAPAEEEPATA
ncbi:MAG: MFS transporter [Alphaproteobacteria bacterium]|nr:MFS transporter [Alphaproteobacteria bacterium]